MSDIDFSDIEGVSEVSSSEKHGSFDDSISRQQCFYDMKTFINNQYSYCPNNIREQFFKYLYQLILLDKSNNCSRNVCLNIQDILQFISNHALDEECIKLQSYRSTINDLELTVKDMITDKNSIQLRYDNLLEQYEGHRLTSQEIQTNIVAEFSSLRSQNKDYKQKIYTLEQELKTSHSLSHESTMSSLLNDCNLQFAVQSKESAEKRAYELETSNLALKKSYDDLVMAHNTLHQELSLTKSENSKLYSRIASLEENLKGLDSAEAAASQAMQSKSTAEKRAAKLEKEIQELHSTISSQSSTIASCKQESSLLKESVSKLESKVDFLIREKLVLSAELAACQSMLSNQRQESVDNTRIIEELRSTVSLKVNEIETMSLLMKDTDDIIKTLRHEIESSGGWRTNDNSFGNSGEDFLQEYEERLRVHEEESVRLQESQLELYDEINRLSSDLAVMTQMNHHLQLKCNSLQDQLSTLT